MKILMLNYEYPPLGGGAGIAMSNMLDEFAGSKELSIDLITSSTGPLEVRPIAGNITGHFLNIGKGGHLHSQSLKDLLRYTFAAIKYARKLVRQNHYDLVHAYFGIPCGYIAMKLGLPYIVSLRGSDVPFHNPKYRLLDILFFKRMSRKIWRRAACVISNSESLKQEAALTAPRQPVEIVYNGVDTRRFFPAEQKNDNTVRFVFTGRLSAIKGLASLVEGYAMFVSKYPEQPAELVLAGDGPMREALEGIVQKHQISQKVCFLGRIENEQVPDILRNGDVFVLTSISEGMPMSILEAMASGLGVICTDIVTLKKLVGDGEGGFIVPKSDAHAIFTAIEKYIQSGKELIDMHGKRNREKALQMSWRHAAEAYIRYYEKTM